jgi:hypothetical protein
MNSMRATLDSRGAVAKLGSRSHDLWAKFKSEIANNPAVGIHARDNVSIDSESRSCFVDSCLLALGSFSLLEFR